MRRKFLLAGLMTVLPHRSRAQDVIPPSLAAAAAAILAHAIVSTRAKAIADGVHSLPSGMHRALLGFFPDALLRRARYSLWEADAIALPSLAFSYGDAAAITLGDLVLFRDPHKAQTDAKLWVHELTHVLQYQRWGVEGFAERYVRDHRAVEQEAYANADRFDAWRAR